MSERYGTVGEMPELLAALEDYCQEQANSATANLRAVTAIGDPRYDAGRLSAYREILDFIVTGD